MTIFSPSLVVTDCGQQVGARCRETHSGSLFGTTQPVIIDHGRKRLRSPFGSYPVKGISTATDTIADMGDKKSIDKLIEKRRGLFIVS
ncbi:MAG: hypothetical protein BHV70_05670 [Bacteroidales bacterium 55_9]|nr:MAG: hypothetical protein BHV70_05670 [Bacteroidales bacterium 55_9]